jgi:high-affinity iron transporter
MFSAATFLITFRESLEAALIVGIILAFLKKSKQTKYNNVAFLGIGAGLVMALVMAYVFETYLGGFTGRTEEIFEGVIMLVAAVLITFMIFWMKKQKSVSQKFHKKIQDHIDAQYPLGIFLLTTLSVGREGIETVIFLNAAQFAGEGTSMFWSGMAGVILAIALGYLIFTTAKKIPLKHFFNATSALLILFAAGLVAHGIHELQEAQLIPFMVEELWNLNPAELADGSYPALHEKGAIGGFFKALFGYNGNPSLIESISYLVYLGAIAFLFQKPVGRNIGQNA